MWPQVTVVTQDRGTGTCSETGEAVRSPGVPLPPATLRTWDADQKAGESHRWDLGLNPRAQWVGLVGRAGKVSGQSQ